jgi:hypothetical protein
MFWGDGEVPRIKQPMEVRAQEQTVVDSVDASGAHWADMSRLQCRQGLLPRDCAPALVRVGHQQAKRALAQALLDQDGVSIKRPLRDLPTDSLST